jgi:hypothetical protein
MSNNAGTLSAEYRTLSQTAVAWQRMCPSYRRDGIETSQP